MLRRILAIAAVVAAGGLLWVVQMTAPTSVHPLVVLLVFIMLYVLALVVLTFFIFWGSRAISRILRTQHAAPPAPVSIYRAYLYASVLAFAPVALLAMRSVGQQGVGEVLLVVLFEVLACFYVWRQS